MYLENVVTYLGLHNKTYRHAGVALAISLLHGGPAPLYLSGTLYELVIGGDLDRNKLTIDMVSDDIIREALTKVNMHQLFYPV